MQHLFSFSRPVAGWLALGAALLAAGSAWAQTPTFAPVVAYGPTSAGTSYAFAVGDLNNDGRPDIVRTNRTAGTVGVLLNTGSGTFGAMQTYPVGTSNQPLAVALGDFNADGNRDVVILNYGANSVGVLLGTGGGNFGLVTLYSLGTGTGPFDLVVADVNADGRQDVLTANLNSNSIAVLLGSGTGSFNAATNYPMGTGTGPNGIRAVDVNGDSKVDIVAANFTNSTVGVLLGSGTGTFGPATTYPAGTNTSPYALVTADVNGDSKPDVLTPNYGTGTVGVLLGTGTGTFNAAQSFSVGASSRPFGVAVADVNGDTRPDVLSVNYADNTVALLLGNSSTLFGPAQLLSTGAGSNPTGIVVTDVNGDNKPDVVVAYSAGTSAVGVLLNTTLLATLPTLPDAAATLHPNPARAAATLTATGLPAGVSQLGATLHDALGRELRRLTVPAAAGAARAEVPVVGLPAGLYLLRLAALDAQGAALGTLPTQRLVVE